MSLSTGLQESTVCSNHRRKSSFCLVYMLLMELKGITYLPIKIETCFLRGESNNVTIICWKKFYLGFIRVANIKISNLTLQNCSMNGTVRYQGFVHCCNQTLLFIGMEGNIILINNIQLTSDSKYGITVYVKGNLNSFRASVQLTNVKSSAGIFIAPYSIVYLASRSVVEINNSSLNNSCIEIRASTNVLSVLDVMIKNTSFWNCSCWSTLIFRGTSRPFSVTLHDVNVSDSRSPYANQTTIHLKGNLNLFHRNKGVMSCT